MSLALIIILILVGIILMLLELFVLPGVLVGIIGLVLTVFSVFHAYSDYDAETGNWVLVGTMAVAAIAFFAFFKLGSFKKIQQQGVIDSKMNVIDPAVFKVGDRGKTLSALRPGGNAMFGEARVEVFSEGGEIIESRTEVVIISIRDNKIFVKKA